eukprot:jgi/Ulvmu1/2102/UM125_0006.1
MHHAWPVSWVLQAFFATIPAVCPARCAGLSATSEGKNPEVHSAIHRQVLQAAPIGPAPVIGNVAAGSSQPASPPLKRTCPPPPPPSQAQTPAADVVVVRSVEALQDATKTCALDVEIQEHLDFRTLEMAANDALYPHAQEYKFAFLYAGKPLRSIRGNCTGPFSALDLDSSLAEELLPQKQGQCLIVVDNSWLMVNSGNLWLDNLYLKGDRHQARAQPLTFIAAGVPPVVEGIDSIEASKVYVTDVTFHSNMARNALAAAFTSNVRLASVFTSRCIFTGWGGSQPPLQLSGRASAHVTNTVFRNMYLYAEIVDVSEGSSVRFQNVSLSHVQLQHGAVVSTTKNDYTGIDACEYEYWPSDHDEYDVDVVPLPVPQSEDRVVGEHYMIVDGDMSDCLFLMAAESVVLPGCPADLRQKRRKIIADHCPNNAGSRGSTAETFSHLDHLTSDSGSRDAAAPEDVTSERGWENGIDPEQEFPVMRLSADDDWFQQLQEDLGHEIVAPVEPANGTAIANGSGKRPNDTSLRMAEAPLTPAVAARILEPLDLSRGAPMHARAAQQRPQETGSDHGVALAAFAAAAVLLCCALCVMCKGCLMMWQARKLQGEEAVPNNSLTTTSPALHSKAPSRQSANNAFSRFALRLTGIPEIPEDTVDTHQSFMHASSGARSGKLRGGTEAGGGLGTPKGQFGTFRPRIAAANTCNPPEGLVSPWWATNAPVDTRVPPAGWQPPFTQGGVSLGETMKASLFDRSAGGARQPPAERQGVLAAAAAAAAHRRARLDVSALPSATAADPAGVAAGGKLGGGLDGGGPADAAGGGDGGTSGAANSDAGRDGDGGSGPLPLLSSIARAASGAAAEAPPTIHAQTGCVTDTMALHTLESSSDDTIGSVGGTPRLAQRAQHAQHAQHAQSALSFAVSANITETMDEDVELPRAEPLYRPGGLPAGHSRSAAWAGPAATYSTLAPSTDTGLSATDVAFSDRHIRALMKQLDAFSSRDLFLGRFEMLGPEQRRRGGQAVIQFARGTDDDLHYAVKFFLEPHAFVVEAALYAACFPQIRSSLSPQVAQHAAHIAAIPTQGGSWPVGRMSAAAVRVLPQVEAVCDGVTGGLDDPRGVPLPPCIVMEKGESLYDWSDRAQPDFFTSLGVLSNISQRLADMHDAGYVHRDLKPANVMWLPRENRWTIIDFGCVAPDGEIAPLNFTLAYAAPEVVKAYHDSEPVIRSSTALDAWSLGVMAFELLTGSPPFRLLTDGRCRVFAQLMGDLPLPWEAELSPEMQRKLGAFKEPVLQLLQRDPSRRIALRRFHDICNRLFANRTTVEA